MNSTVQLPLSGAVNQTINPWNFWQQITGNQFSLVTVNMGKSSAPDMEPAILAKVGSYGSQIGKIGDALGAVISVLGLDTPESLAKMTDLQQAAILELLGQLREVAAVKKGIT